jgi:hypothetical protein
MTDKETRISMLHAAVAWQEGYVDAVKGTEYEEEARALLKRYRAYLKKATGSAKTRSEQRFDEIAETASHVSFTELVKRK